MMCVYMSNAFYRSLSRSIAVYREIWLQNTFITPQRDYRDIRDIGSSGGAWKSGSVRIIYNLGGIASRWKAGLSARWPAG